MSDEKKQLRSSNWFADRGTLGFTHRSWLKNQGYPDDMFDGRPVIGICNTWSELTPCNAHLRVIAEFVKRGVYEAGGFPLEFPVMSLGEILMRPTTMLYRNLASMDVEESIRANPLDGVVLLTGCDKTTPSTIMGAASVGLPTLVVNGGPMLNGKYRGTDIGSGTDVWKFTDEVRKGTMSMDEYMEAESCMSRSDGHCMTMGTASTMACMVEALGLTLPGAAAIPAPDSRRRRLAQLSGRRIVDMVKEDLTLDKILTREAFENAIVLNAAVGGSSNFIVHLLAIAGRMGIELVLEDFDRLGSHQPLLVNLMPSGQYLMEDFYYAGGLPAVIKTMASELHEGALTVNGKSLGENCKEAPNYNGAVIYDYEAPLQKEAGLVVLKGNLCERGAIIKPSAATQRLLKHQARAVVFEDYDDYHARIDDPNLDVDKDSILVLKNVGPKGYPGMPEVGNFHIPEKLLKKGVVDMIRISDGRMSGTAFGTVVLHVAPESAIGGNLALVEDGDMIELDVEQRLLQLHVSDVVLQERRQNWTARQAHMERGYVSMYLKHVLQADQGVDFDFLVGNSGAFVSNGNH